MKELEKLSVSVLKVANKTVKSITYKNGELNVKCVKGLDKEVKSCTICLTLAMVIINILSTTKIKDKDNQEMLRLLHKTIDKAFNMLDFRRII